MSLQAIDLLWSLCSQTSLLMIICSFSQLQIWRLPPHCLNLYLSHVQFTVGFALLWESNAAADLTGGGAQAVMRVMGVFAVGDLLGTGPHSKRWVVGERVTFHLYLQLLPIIRITAWAPPRVRSAAALDSHRSANPTVNCAWEGSRLRPPYENLMPDDLRWSWGSDASAGERLQIQIIYH